MQALAGARLQAQVAKVGIGGWQKIHNQNGGVIPYEIALHTLIMGYYWPPTKGCIEKQGLGSRGTDNGLYCISRPIYRGSRHDFHSGS